MVISNLCNYSDVHIVGKGRLTVEGNALNNRANKKLNFKDNAPFRSWIKNVMTHLQTMRTILTLLCRCIICQNISAIIL